MDSFIACHDCDLVHRIKAAAGQGGGRMYPVAVRFFTSTNPTAWTVPWHLPLAGLILFILANSFPFLALRIGSQVRETTLITGIHELYRQGMQTIAILVLLTTVLVPFTQMMCLFYILLPLKFGRVPKRLPWVLRFLEPHTTLGHDGSFHGRYSGIGCKTGQNGENHTGYLSVLIFGAHFRPDRHDRLTG